MPPPSWRCPTVPPEVEAKVATLKCYPPQKNGCFQKIVGFPPKSSILIRFSIINHPFWGPTPISGNAQIVFQLPSFLGAIFLVFVAVQIGTLLIKSLCALKYMIYNADEIIKNLSSM